jgi:predicted dehydrogenase
LSIRRDEIGVGVIGLGFMGRTHLGAYRAAAAAGQANRLIAVCDKDPERFRGGTVARGNIEQATDEERLFDPAETEVYGDPAELLANAAVQLVSICTHTDTHVELALQALEAGKHVLVEKPVAMDPEQADRLAEAARHAGTICMPAMCMRFWPGWSWLGQVVRDERFGKVRSAVFRRLASHPGWSPEFYADPNRSGGALFDLHVHDADFVRWLFGAPAAVTSTGSVDHVTTAYHFDSGPAHVIAEGGWDHTDGFAFHMGFTVVFDEATADFAFGRAQPLLLARSGKSEPVELAEGTGYDGEVRHLLAACAGTVEHLEATIDEAAGLTRMLVAERESLIRGTRVVVETA